MMNNDLSVLSKEIHDSVLRKELTDIGTMKSFKKGETIVQDGKYINFIPIILKGSLKVVQEDDEGREFLLYYLTQGESCIMSILGGFNHEPSKVRVMVESDADVMMIPIQNASQWIKKYPEWTDFVFRLYQKRFEELLAVVKRVTSKHLDVQIWDLLQLKSQLSQSKTINITHQQLADELGSNRVVVSRILKEMEHKGKISLSRNIIKII